MEEFFTKVLPAGCHLLPFPGQCANNAQWAHVRGKTTL